MGDTVVLIAPARSISQNEIRQFKEWVEEQGWKIEFAPNVFEVFHQFSGTDQHRAQDLIWAFGHPTAKAIFCARGGYGSIRTLNAADKILGSFCDWLSLQSPKWFVGFSDMTTIHSALQSIGCSSIHGPLASQWSTKHNWASTNQHRLVDVLNGKKTQMDFSELPNINLKSFQGMLIGGNLSLIYASLGTKYQLETSGKVVLIEDVDEYLYHIDRMLIALDMAGVFNEISGLLVGSMVEMKDNTVPFGFSARDSITSLLGNRGFPIVFDVPIGHNEQNIAVKLGFDCTFEGNIFTQIA